MAHGGSLPVPDTDSSIHSEAVPSEADAPLSASGSPGLDDTHEQISGWLLKRTRFSHKWKRQWFLLDRSTLQYGNSDKDISKKIALEGARILESNKDNRPHTFSVKPRSGKHVYYLQADDEIGRNKWMQAICFAKMTNSVEERDSMCRIL